MAFYDGDTKLGEDTTDSTGACTIPNVTLSEGEHDIFVVVTDGSGNKLAGAMAPATEITSGTTTVDTTVNTDEDFAYKTWLAACADQLGTECVLGANVSTGAEAVVPGCIHDFIRQAIDSDTTASVDDETVADHFRAMRELHLQNLSLETPVDMSCVMKGDAACQADLVSRVGSEVNTLVLKGAIATSLAGVTASEMVDNVVECLCGDKIRFEAIASDTGYQADRGALQNLFLMVKPDELPDFDPAVMAGIIDSAPAVGSGIVFFRDPFAARTMWETVKVGGVTNTIDASEKVKRMSAIMGAPPPTTFTAGAEMARAAFNIYGSNNWSGATAENAVNQFGPLLGQQGFRDDCIEGGAQTFDSLISAKGGMTGFIGAFNSFGNAETFFAAIDPKDIGVSCIDTFGCLSPGICSAGKCSIGSFSSDFVGMGGTSCTANSDCATAVGFTCDAAVHKCVYQAGQAQGGNFAIGGGTFTAPTAGSEGASCTSNSQCSGGRICNSGGCFTPPPAGFTGGAPLGASCTSNSGCTSQSCINSLCAVSGGNTSGMFCTSNSQCATGLSCNGSICSSQTTPLSDGSSCSVGGQCQSGFCTGGTCTAGGGGSGGGSLKANGNPCTGNTECQSGFCTAGLCSAQSGSGSLKADGQTCSFPAECQSNNCISGTCQPQGSLKPAGMHCATGVECQSGLCPNFVCM